MIDQFVQWDEALFLFLNNLGSTPFDQFWLTITSKYTWIPLYLLILIYLYVKEGWKAALTLLIMALVIVGITDQITNLLKEDWIGRYRPCYTDYIVDKMRLVKDTCGGKYSFTSGHAGNHFALAVLLSFSLKKYIGWIAVPLLIWAALIAYSRIYIGVHFPLDVICGALLGASISLISIYLANKFILR